MRATPRSRPYRKSDNAHVEQKNGRRVRRLFGNARIDHPEWVEPMNDIATLQSRFDNLYCPTQRLLSKRRERSKYIQTPENADKTTPGGPAGPPGNAALLPDRL